VSDVRLPPMKDGVGGIFWSCNKARHILASYNLSMALSASLASCALSRARAASPFELATCIAWVHMQSASCSVPSTLCSSDGN
jgi:hypothetical protein